MKKKLVRKDDNVPALMISQGEHSRRPDDNVPALMISQGAHSIKPEKTLERFLASRKKDMSEEFEEKVKADLNSKPTLKHYDLKDALRKFSEDHHRHQDNGQDIHDTVYNLMDEHPLSRLPREDRSVLTRYSIDSSVLNSHMFAAHQKEKGREYDPHEYRPTSENNSEIQSLKASSGKFKLERPLTVFSGIKKWHPPTEIAKARGLVDLPAFTSTSLDAGQADHFSKAQFKERGEPGDYGIYHARHMVRFHLPEGHPIIPLLQHSRHPNEHEIVLPPGRFQLSSTPTVLRHPNSDEEIHLWDAHPVHPL